MCKCILCADVARERKYFFKNKPLCNYHYIEYLELVVDDSDSEITEEVASSTFEKLKLLLEPRPMTTEEREEKERLERERREEEEREKEKKQKAAYPEPTPYNDPFRMGM